MSKKAKRKPDKLLNANANRAEKKACGVAGIARPFIVAVFALAGLLALWALFSIAGGESATTQLASAGWGGLASIIVRNRNSALLHALFMTLYAAAFLWLFFSGKIRSARTGATILWITVLLVALDAFRLSRHYIQTMPASFVEESALVSILKIEPEHKRVALVTQQGFYNALLTYTFPYYGIRSINITQMPRMREDYRNFLNALGHNSVRMWQLCSVGYIVAPAQIMPQIGNNPVLKDSFDLVYSFNMQPAGDGGMKLVAATQAQPGEHVVLRSRLDSPRFTLVAGWMETEDDTALNNLVSDHFPLFRKIMIAPEDAASLPPSTGEGMVGAVLVRDYRPGRFTLNVSTDRRAILRIAEKYDPDWRAYINGCRAPVLRADYIFQGVFVEPGLHEVVLKYAPDKWTLWLQALCLVVCAVAAISIFRKHYLSKLPPTSDASNG